MDLLPKLKDRIRKVLTPRPKTDLESEILNIVSAPIYLFTITGVYYYSWVYVMPYFYPDYEIITQEEIVQGENQNGRCNVVLLLQRALLTLIYFEMMSNWLCIRLVGNKPRSTKETSGLNDVFMSLSSNEKQSSDFKHAQEINGNSIERNTPNHGVNKERILMYREKNGSREKPLEQKRSYWAWNRCDKCDHDSPPRCHHCPMCETCVLKRDHHCFFSGKCVGFYNQRYFIVFLIWAVFGTSYTTLYFSIYLKDVLWPQMIFLDIFPTFTLVRWMFGTGSLFLTAMLFTFLFNLLFVFLSLTFLIEQYSLVCSGLTQFEAKALNRQKLDIIDPRNLESKIRAVMGRYYGISIFLPMMHLLFPPCENPYDWLELKIIRKMK